MRRLVPEVIQTSALDCGPAALKSMLEGHGVRASYGRLREACRTDIDGTSIDALEDVANELGLDAEQVIVPVDHVLPRSAGNLPAIAVVREPGGATHFVVLWSIVGGWVQVMDPGVGRQWVTLQSVLDRLYVHEMDVGESDFEAFARSEAFTAVLAERIDALGVPATARQHQLDTAAAASGAVPLAVLDAATRMTQALVDSGGVHRGPEAARLLGELVEGATARPDDAPIPPRLWTARPVGTDEDGEPILRIRGAVLMRVVGVHDQASASTPELAAALSEPADRPGETVVAMLREDGLLAPGLLVGLMGVSGVAVLTQALVLRALMATVDELAVGAQRLGAIAALVVLVVAGMGLQYATHAGLFRLGRGLEVRLQLAFRDKLPRLEDRYLASRLTSDMAERSHALHRIRELPMLGAALIQGGVSLVLTLVGIALLDPRVAPVALLAAAVGVAVPTLALPVLAERDLRMRGHAGALSRFYLDAVLGLVAIRSHGGEVAVRRNHEGKLVEWARAALGLHATSAVVDGIQAGVGAILTIAALAVHMAGTQETGAVLLLVYWTLQVPVLADGIAMAARQYPSVRSAVLRATEPLGALESGVAVETAPATPSGPPALALREVAVRASGHTLLDEVTVAIPAGAHVAVVGRSGAGKSTLLGLLLGWHRPAAGVVEVDGVPLDGASLTALRRRTAWLDPGVHLWNRTVLENLLYGQTGGDLAAVLEESDLLEVLRRKPEGLQAPVGEGGGALSGGEGQRIRLGRALLRASADLVLLDEPFRGLDSHQRQRMLDRVRARFAGATLLFVTHDVASTRGFERVLVVEGGQIVEDDAPDALLARPDSMYGTLYAAQQAAATEVWGSEDWRRLWVEDGVVSELGGGAP